MTLSLNDFVVEAKKKGKKRLVVAYGQDQHTLEAANDAVEMGIVDVTLVGDSSVIKQVCEANGIDVGRFTIINEPNDIKCVDIAVKMVSEGKGDILMKGLVSTDKYMRGLLNKEFGLLPPKGILSHLTIMELPTYRKPLFISDVAIIPYPDLKQKQAIINYLIDTARTLGVKTPKVACLAPSEQVLSGIISCEEAAILAKMGDRGVFGDAIVDGPLALDVAVSPEVVELKKLKGSKVNGDADCLLFPNLDAGNLFFKFGTQLANARIACVVVGTNKPCVLTSRGDSRDTKLNSIALACLSVK